jgi:hypothetical protein
MSGRMWPTRPQAGQRVASDISSSQAERTPQALHSARSCWPCMWMIFRDPARSCRLSTFCVTSRNSPSNSRSSRASPKCAAFGSTPAALRRRQL